MSGSGIGVIGRPCVAVAEVKCTRRVAGAGGRELVAAFGIAILYGMVAEDRIHRNASLARDSLGSNSGVAAANARNIAEPDTRQ